MKKQLSIAMFVTLLIFSYRLHAQNQNRMNASKIELLSPEGLTKNPAYSQVAIIEGNNRTIYVGGQNSVDKDGKIIGKGDIEAQAKQILQNLQTALKAGGGTFEDIIKWNIYIVQGQSTEKALKVFQGAMSKMKAPPLITGIFVSSLAQPDFLLEIECIAVVPLK